MNYISALILPLVFAAQAYAQTPIRLGMGLNAGQLPSFTDENLLSSIKFAVENSAVNPIFTIGVGVSKEHLSVFVKGKDGGSEFLCTPASCVNRGSIAKAHSQVTYTEIPFGNVKAYGFKNQNEAFELGTMGWIAVSAVAFYFVKKGINRVLTGKYLASTDGHSHFFMSPEDMAENMTANQRIMDKAEEKLELDVQNLAAPLIKIAACGHHHHGHGPCAGTSEAEIVAAQRSLLWALPRFTFTLIKDFYQEVLAPMVDLGRALLDPFKRRQMYSFAELVSLRMLKERGVGPALTSIAFIATAEAVYETFESMIMPGGAHVACTIGNIVILGIAASAYTAYHCMRETSMLQGLSASDRFQIAGRVSRINWRANHGLQAKSEGLDEGERSALAMNVIFRLVERDVRHALDLRQIDHATGRNYARQLGELKRELNSLTIKSVMNPLTMEDVRGWIARLAQIRTALSATSTMEDCAAALGAAAS